MSHPRRFAPPWSIEELEACFIVKEGAGQKLAYVNFEHEPGRRSAAKRLTKDEAQRNAANIAKLLAASKVIHVPVPMSALGGKADITVVLTNGRFRG